MRKREGLLNRLTEDLKPDTGSLNYALLRAQPWAGQEGRNRRSRWNFWMVVLAVAAIPLGVFIRGDLGHRGSEPNAIWNSAPAVLEIATLVLREGLECVLVLAALTAGLKGARKAYRSSIAVGVGMGFAATYITWRVAVRMLADLGKRSSALAMQAGTGLVAIIVLLVVMNWFFHKLYWTRWISLHQQRKQKVLRAVESGGSDWGVRLGMASVGLTSFYREGFEVVLFLQSYRLRLGSAVVSQGVMLGLAGTVMVAVLTFVANRRLPYRRMLIATGLMLAFVLLVMVGEEVQEMQLAGWLPATRIPWLARVTPSWMDFWFSLVPTAESLGGQALAGLLVFGSYFIARFISHQRDAGEPN